MYYLLNTQPQQNLMLGISKKNEKGISSRGTLKTPSSNPKTDGVILPSNETPLYDSKVTNKPANGKANMERFATEKQKFREYVKRR